MSDLYIISANQAEVQAIADTIHATRLAGGYHATGWYIETKYTGDLFAVEIPADGVHGLAPEVAATAVPKPSDWDEPFEGI